MRAGAEWCVRAVNLVQGLIGCAYGHVSVDTIASTAAQLRPPEQPYEHIFIRGVVFDCVTRKMQTLSVTERALLTEVVEEVGRTSQADITKVVTDFRALLGIHGPGLAERIRDIVDERYRLKLSARLLSSELNVSVGVVKSEFERRFGITIAEYLTRRRVEEGARLIRAGIKVEAAALEVGYRSKRHFYAAVRKLVGTTPKQLRSLS